MEEELTTLLNDFLDNEDEELEEMFLEVLENRSVFTFLSVLYKIDYPRIDELIKRTKELVFEQR